uniref:AMP-dependent synthetase/ligase domain-containing protein n=1 Tax=Oscillatoriales cyanobacterium SpSt-418 TaxID=2282169 RepID=A0A7C3PJQ8_9CYAN
MIQAARSSVHSLEHQHYCESFGSGSFMTESDVEQCIHHWFEVQVEQTPDAIALLFNGQQLTYRSLNQKANQLAHYLLQQGLQPQELVVVSVERSLEMVVGFLAVLKAGGAYVPIDPAIPPNDERIN